MKETLALAYNRFINKMNYLMWKAIFILAEFYVRSFCCAVFVCLFMAEKKTGTPLACFIVLALHFTIFSLLIVWLIATWQYVTKFNSLFLLDCCCWSSNKSYVIKNFNLWLCILFLFIRYFAFVSFIPLHFISIWLQKRTTLRETLNKHSFNNNRIVEKFQSKFAR